PQSQCRLLPGQDTRMGHASLRTTDDSVGCRDGRRGSPGLKHREDLCGKEFESLLCYSIGSSPEAKRDIEFKITEKLTALFDPPQDLVWSAPAGGAHEARDGAFDAALPGNGGFLLIGIIAFDGLKMFP